MEKIAYPYYIDESCILEHYPNFKSDVDENLLSAAWDFLDQTIVYDNINDIHNRKSCSTVKGHCAHTLEFYSLPIILQGIIQEIAVNLGYNMENINKTWFAHINMYFNGVGIGAHSDKEILGNNFVFSYTLLINDKSKLLPRKFEVGKKIVVEETDELGHKIKNKKFKILESILLKHGDGCRMNGSDFQQKYLHRIKSSSSKNMMGHKRLNITIRPMVPNKLGVFNWNKNNIVVDKNDILPPINGWTYGEKIIKNSILYFFRK